MDAECICTSSIDVQIFHGTEVGGDEAQGREQRDNNRNPSIWDQGW